jgi:hypothetical protein
MHFKLCYRTQLIAILSFNMVFNQEVIQMIKTPIAVLIARLAFYKVHNSNGNACISNASLFINNRWMTLRGLSGCNERLMLFY